MKIAVEGCCHGELNKIYEALQHAEQKQGIKIDLLICCGDFQAVRNQDDLLCMAAPEKYRQLMNFHEYYSGKRQAPILTLFIGGNHEASNHLWELGYGGWVAPNIYYLGFAGVVKFGGVRIGGLSGIYKHHSYHKNHFERPPYDSFTIRSAYHVRSCDHFRLKQVSGKVDIMLSHDWPRGIEHHGNTHQLLQWKPHFRQDVDSQSLGSPPAMDLLRYLKPLYWFSAHLHVKFPALYEHDKGQSSSGEVKSSNCRQFTKFLSLDKCLPRRSYLQIVDVTMDTVEEGPYKLTYDPEWLAILRSTEQLMCYDNSRWMEPFGKCCTPSLEDLVYVEHTLFRGDLTIPTTFECTAHTLGETPKPVVSGHPQTERLCQTLDISNPFKHDRDIIVSVAAGDVSNPDEISLDDDEVAMVSSNPDEMPQDAGVGGWVIDTAGKNRTRLSLPPPTNQPESHDQSHDSAPVSHDQPREEASHDQPKIKRRNIALYSMPAQSDDEEDT
ncbi:uncharacterized protein LOC135335991 [Halichondria panicea]|uniref:uncharacterized protein LOC135335991 n=1 Tax=Halichondria panicea TaxID=6063 RepID=UPI00312B58EE